VSKQLPKAVNQFRKRHPKVWEAFNDLGERIPGGSPASENSGSACPGQDFAQRVV
jgi:hypothetical protein